MKTILVYIVKHANVEAMMFSQFSANAYALQIEGAIVEQGTMQVPIRSKSDQLTLDLSFGKQLIELFLDDNRNDPNVTTAQSIALLTRFESIANLLRFGDIKTAKILITNEVTDAVFTQTRKDKYLQLIDAHLQEAAIFA
jgi:hypothetical protein